jgi:hypothetical protein
VKARKVKIAVAVATASVAALGLAHVPAVRGVVLGQACPFGHTASAAEIENRRVKTAASLRGTKGAPARPAFGFTLGESTRDDVTTWGSHVGATCNREQNDTAIRCEDAKVEGGGVSDAFFRFDPKGRLVGVDIMREGMTPSSAAELYRGLAAKTTGEVGAPTTHQGEATEALLGSNLARASAEYRFSNYAADLSVTNLGSQGVVVREQYRSLD